MSTSAVTAALAAARQAVDHPRRASAPACSRRARCGRRSGRTGRAPAPAPAARRAAAAPAAIGGVSSGAPVSADDFARDAVDAEAVRQVGRELEREQRCRRACSTSRMSAPDGRIGSQFQQAAMVVGTASARAPSTACPGSRRRAACRRLISNGLPSSPGGSSAPTRASGTLMPTRALGAPQTMLQRPRALRQRRPGTRAGGRRCGCCSASDDLADHDAAERRRHRAQRLRPPGRTSSAGRPARRVDSGGLQNSRNQDSGNCISCDLSVRSAELRRKRRSPSKNRRRSLTP